jgi:hypothetical protein
MFCKEPGKGEGRGICTSVVFAVIGDHQHHLPLKDIVVYQPTGYSRKVFGGLNAFQLPCQEPGCSARLGHLATLRDAAGGVCFETAGWGIGSRMPFVDLIDADGVLGLVK